MLNNKVERATDQIRIKPSVRVKLKVRAAKIGTTIGDLVEDMEKNYKNEKQKS